MMLFDMRQSVTDLSKATLKQRIAHDLCDGSATQRELDAAIGAKSGCAIAMRLYRMRQRLGLPRRQKRVTQRRRACIHQLSIFDGL